MTRVDDLLAVASAQLGKPYQFGDEGPAAFDCSGLVQFAFAKLGIGLPRTAAAQQRATTRVDSPLPGDLVFFGSPAYHVGIYVGSGQMISAPHAGATVHLTSVGTATSYGRVGGLGALTAPIVGTVGLFGSTVADWLSGARTITFEALAVVAGLGLVAAGLWRATSSQRHKLATKEVLP